MLRLFLISIFVFSVVWAQYEYHTESYIEYDVVYLKNGSVYRGIITEKIPDVSLKLMDMSGNTLVFDFKDIDKITKERIVTGGTTTYNPTSTTEIKIKIRSSFFIVGRTGYFMGDFKCIPVDFFMGVRFGRLAPCVGFFGWIGKEEENYGGGIFGEGRFFCMPGNIVSPTLHIDIGYMDGEYIRGGIFSGAGVGVDISTGPHVISPYSISTSTFGIFFEFSYRLIHGKILYDNGYETKWIRQYGILLGINRFF